MAEIKTGFAFHVHHDVLVEFCTDYDKRVKYIRTTKPKEEQELRLRLFKLIPSDHLPKNLLETEVAYNEVEAVYDEAKAAYNKARAAFNEARVAYNVVWTAYDEAYDKARTACNEARAAYASLFEQLHQELCPDCPWDGQTIFSVGTY